MNNNDSCTLLIGLDGFDPVLAQQWMDSGDLPNLKKIASDGLFTPLKSTIPPFTYPAWSSLITGVNPGEHGMIDFAIRKPGNTITPGSYDVEYVNSSFRKAPTVFKRLSNLGHDVIAMGFPSTYPPEQINGIMISGFDSPLAVSADRSFCHPPELWDELLSTVNPYTLAGIQELNTGGQWHKSAAKRILQTINERTAIAQYLMTEKPWDLFAMVFSESDTAAHHFWTAHDVKSPRHSAFSRVYGSYLRDFLKSVYQSLDSAVGKLIATAQKQFKSKWHRQRVNIMIVSDHGSGGTGINRFSINRVLAEHGLFTYRSKTENSSASNLIKPLARLLPAGVGQWLFRHGPSRLLAHLESSNRLSNADLTACHAFSDELNYFPAVWINDDRFPKGDTISTRKRNALCESIVNALEKVKNPFTDQPVVRKVYRSDSIYHGRAMEIMPDLVLDLNLDNGYSYAIWNAPTPGSPVEPLPKTEWIGRKGGSMNGSHRQHGVLFLNHTAGWSFPTDPDIEYAGQHLLHLCGFSSLALKTHDKPSKTQTVQPYTEEQARELEDRLRDLGYLE